MAKLRLYKTYMFRDKDPIIDELRTALQDEYGSTRGAEEIIHNASGVSIACQREWFEGKTMKPQHATIRAVVGCLQTYEYRLVKLKGTVGKKIVAKT